MPRKSALEQQGESLKRMASVLSRAATVELPGWNELFFDVRFDGGTSVERMVIRKDKKRVDIYAPNEVSQYRDRLWTLRKKLPNGDWYGLFMHIDSEGSVEVKYDYDPQCVSTFFEDEDNHRPF